MIPHKRERNELISWWDAPEMEPLPLIPKGGVDILRTPSELGAHTHRGYEITCLLKGEVHWLLEDGTRLHLVGGDAALTQPYVIHCGDLDIIQPCVLVWLVIHPWAEEVTKNTPLRPDDVRWIEHVLQNAGNCVVRATAPMIATARRLQNLVCSTHGKLSPHASRIWLHSLLTQLLLAAVESFDAHGSIALSPSIVMAIDYLNRHSDESIKMSDVSHMIDLSPSRFYQRFKDEVGLTPVDYLTRIRIQRARTMLADVNMPITTIAYDLGFASSQYFARIFRKYTGLTPSAYRASPQCVSPSI